MRCYFWRNSRIVAVHVLEPVPSSDQEAVNRALAQFNELAPDYEAFEVWDGERMVYRHMVRNSAETAPPPPAAE